MWLDLIDQLAYSWQYTCVWFVLRVAAFIDLNWHLYVCPEHYLVYIDAHYEIYSSNLISRDVLSSIEDGLNNEHLLLPVNSIKMWFWAIVTLGKPSLLHGTTYSRCYDSHTYGKRTTPIPQVFIVAIVGSFPPNEDKLTGLYAQVNGQYCKLYTETHCIVGKIISILESHFYQHCTYHALPH